MAHELIRLLSKLHNTPHLMEPEHFTRVISILESRDDAVELAVRSQDKQKKIERDLQYNPDTKVGMIVIDGPLTYLEFQGWCGEQNASYQRIESEFVQMIDKGAKTIVMSIDSGGGEAYGMFETGRLMREKADAAGVNLIAYVDGMAASAAYGLACSAHEIIMNPHAEVGSIGVVVRLRNVNKAMKAMGVEDTFIFAGDSKIPFAADGSWDKKFLEDIQEKVDELYQQFTSYVADMRGIEQKAAQKTEAKVFTADKAMELGLVDKQMTREGFFEYLADIAQSGETMLGRKLFSSDKEDKAQMTAEQKAQLEALQGQVVTLTANLDKANAAVLAANAALLDKGVEVETANCALTEAKEKLGVYEKAEAAKLEAEVTAKKNARKEKLAAFMSAEAVEKLFPSLEALDDEAFEMVIAPMQVKAETDLMTQELGAGADADSRPVTDGVAKLIAAAYPQTKK